MAAGAVLMGAAGLVVLGAGAASAEAGAGGGRGSSTGQCADDLLADPGASEGGGDVEDECLEDTSAPTPSRTPDSSSTEDTSGGHTDADEDDSVPAPGTNGDIAAVDTTATPGSATSAPGPARAGDDLPDPATIATAAAAPDTVPAAAPTDESDGADTTEDGASDVTEDGAAVDGGQAATEVPPRSGRTTVDEDPGPRASAPLRSDASTGELQIADGQVLEPVNGDEARGISRTGALPTPLAPPATVPLTPVAVQAGDDSTGDGVPVGPTGGDRVDERPAAATAPAVRSATVDDRTVGNDGGGPDPTGATPTDARPTSGVVQEPQDASDDGSAVPLREQPGVLVASADLDRSLPGVLPTGGALANAGQAEPVARSAAPGGRAATEAPVVVDYQGTGSPRSQRGKEERTSRGVRITPTKTRLPNGDLLLEWEEYAGPNRYDHATGQIVVDAPIDAQSSGTQRMVLPGDAAAIPPALSGTPSRQPAGPTTRTDSTGGSDTTTGRSQGSAPTPAAPSDGLIGRLAPLPDGTLGVVVEAQDLEGTGNRDDIRGSMITVQDPRGPRYVSVQPTRAHTPDGTRLFIPEVSGELVASNPVGNTVAVYRLGDGETGRITPQTPVRQLQLPTPQGGQASRYAPDTSATTSTSSPGGSGATRTNGSGATATDEEVAPPASDDSSVATSGLVQGVLPRSPDETSGPITNTGTTGITGTIPPPATERTFTFDPSAPNPWKGPIYAGTGAIASYLTQKALNRSLTLGQYLPNGARGAAQDIIFAGGAPCVQFKEEWSYWQDALLRGACGAALTQALAVSARRGINPALNAASDAFNTDPRSIALSRTADPGTARILNDSLRARPPAPRANIRSDFALTGRLGLPLLDPRTTTLSPDVAANTSPTRFNVGPIPDIAYDARFGDGTLRGGASFVDDARRAGAVPVRPTTFSDAPELTQPTRRGANGRLPDTTVPPFPTYAKNPVTGRYQQSPYNVFDLRQLPKNMQTQAQRITDLSTGGMIVGGSVLHAGIDWMLKKTGQEQNYPLYVSLHSLADGAAVGTALSVGEGRMVPKAYLNPTWQSALAQLLSHGLLALAPPEVRQAMVDACSDANQAVNAIKWFACNVGQKGGGGGGLPPTTPPDGMFGGGNLASAVSSGSGAGLAYSGRLMPVGQAASEGSTSPGATSPAFTADGAQSTAGPVVAMPPGPTSAWPLVPTPVRQPVPAGAQQTAPTPNRVPSSGAAIAPRLTATSSRESATPVFDGQLPARSPDRQPTSTWTPETSPTPGRQPTPTPNRQPASTPVAGNRPPTANWESSPALNREPVNSQVSPATPTAPARRQAQQADTRGGPGVPQWLSDFATGPTTMSRSKDGTTYTAAGGVPFVSSYVGVYDATTGELISTEKGTPPPRVNTWQYMDPKDGAIALAAATVPLVAAKVAAGSGGLAALSSTAARTLGGGGQLAGAGGLGAVLPAVALPPRVTESAREGWNGITERAGQLWNTVTGSPGGSSGSQPAPTTGRSGSSVGQRRVGDGTPESAAAANRYNWDTFRIRTNYVGNKQPPPPAQSQTGAGTGSTGASRAATGSAPAASGSSNRSSTGRSAPQSPPPQQRSAAPAQQPASTSSPAPAQQVRQAVATVAEKATNAASSAGRQAGDVLDSAADTVVRNAGPLSGILGGARKALGWDGDGDPNR